MKVIGDNYPYNQWNLFSLNRNVNIVLNLIRKMNKNSIIVQYSNLGVKQLILNSCLDHKLLNICFDVL